MGKLRTFFYVLSRTFTDPSYYAEITKTKFGFSFQYFLMFFLIYAAVGTAYFGARMGPKIVRVVNSLPEKISEIYPDELVVQVKNGAVSTNVQEPYYLPIDQIEKKFMEDNVLGDNTEKIKNLVVIDTAGDVENFESYQTVMLVTDKTVVIQDSEGVKMNKIDPMVNVVIDRNLVRTGMDKVRPYLGYVMPLMLAGVFLGLSSGVVLYYLMYLLFFGLLLWILSSILNKDLGYKKSYQWGLHLCTISAAVLGIMLMWGIKLEVPFMQTTFLLIVGYLALSKLKNKSATLNN